MTSRRQTNSGDGGTAMSMQRSGDRKRSEMSALVGPGILPGVGANQPLPDAPPSPRRTSSMTLGQEISSGGELGAKRSIDAPQKKSDTADAIASGSEPSGAEAARASTVESIEGVRSAAESTSEGGRPPLSLKMYASPKYTVRQPPIPSLGPFRLISFDADAKEINFKVVTQLDREGRSMLVEGLRAETYSCDLKLGGADDEQIKIEIEGKLSKRCGVTLGETLKASLRLPDEASYAFAYPSEPKNAEGLQDYVQVHLDNDFAQFAMFGGFVYFDKDGKPCKLCPIAPGADHLEFAGPYRLTDALEQWFKEARKSGAKPTLQALTDLGVKTFCWLAPCDVPDAQEWRGMWPHGAFVYFFDDPEKNCMFKVLGPKLKAAPNALEIEWEKVRNKEEELPGTFGKITFRPRAQRHSTGEFDARYACFSALTKPADVYKLLREDWELRKPSAVISVTGSAQNMDLEPQLEELIKEGLAEVARCTKAWMITAGTDTGVMALTGSAVAQEQDVQCIGIVSWGMTMHRDKFHEARNKSHEKYIKGEEFAVGATETQSNVIYTKRKRNRAGGGVAIDPNHTHFLMVDIKQNASKYGPEEYDFGGELGLRSQLESTLQQHNINTVCVCIQGGASSFQQIRASLDNRCPVLLVEDAGGCAQVLAELVQGLLSRPPSERKLKEALLKRIEVKRNDWETLLSVGREEPIKFGQGEYRSVDVSTLVDIGMRLELLSVFSRSSVERKSFASALLELIITSYRSGEELSNAKRMKQLQPVHRVDTHVIARNNALGKYPVRAHIPDTNVPWSVPFEGYTAPEFTDEASVIKARFADVEDAASYIGWKDVEIDSHGRLWIKSAPHDDVKESRPKLKLSKRENGSGKVPHRWLAHRRTYENLGRMQVSTGDASRDQLIAEADIADGGSVDVSMTIGATGHVALRLQAMDELMEVHSKLRPLNPAGRCGLRGRGMLPFWGPSIAIDNIITRVMMVHRKDGIPEPSEPRRFEVLCIRRETQEWGLPGEFRDIPGNVELRQKELCHKAVCKVIRPLLEIASRQDRAAAEDDLKAALKAVVEMKRQELKDYSGFIAEAPMRKSLQESEVQGLLDAMTEEKFELGDVVLKEGDKGDACFIIREGAVKCTKESQKEEVSDRLKKGDFFGELALISGSEGKRAVTVTTTAPTTLLCLKRDAFKRLLDPKACDSPLLVKRFFGYDPSKRAGDTCRPIFRGYHDDPRNTDNAWIETEVWHCHLEDEQKELRQLFEKLVEEEKTSAGLPRFAWIPIDDDNDRYVHFFGAHKSLVDLTRDVYLHTHPRSSQQMQQEFSTQWFVPRTKEAEKEADKKYQESLKPVTEAVPDATMVSYEDLAFFRKQIVVDKRLAEEMDSREAEPHLTSQRSSGDSSTKPGSTKPGISKAGSSKGDTTPRSQIPDFKMAHTLLNPRGRTGKKRHDEKYGPAHQAYLIVTRKKPADEMPFDDKATTYQILKAINGMLPVEPLPCDDLKRRLQGDDVKGWKSWKQLKKVAEAAKEEKGSKKAQTDNDLSELFEDALQEVSTVYQGYLDHEANTDNFWLEATVAHVNFIPDLGELYKATVLLGETEYTWCSLESVGSNDPQKHWEHRVKRRMDKRNLRQLLTTVVGWGRFDLLETVLVEAKYIRQRSVRQVQDAFEQSLRLCAKGDISPMLPELLLQHGARLQSIEPRKRLQLFVEASAGGFDTLGLMRKGLDRSSFFDQASESFQHLNSMPLGTPRNRNDSVEDRNAQNDIERGSVHDGENAIDDFIESYLVVGFKLYRQLRETQSKGGRGPNDPPPRKDRDDLYFILWALACGAPDLAFMLWSQTAQPLRSALIAQGVCHKLERRFADEDQAGRVDKIRHARQRFQEAASEVLDRLRMDVAAAEEEGGDAADRQLPGSPQPRKPRSSSSAFAPDAAQRLPSANTTSRSGEIQSKQMAQKELEGKLLLLLYGEGGMEFDPTTVLGNKTVGNRIARMTHGITLVPDCLQQRITMLTPAPLSRCLQAFEVNRKRDQAAAQGLIALAIELKNKEFLSHRLVRTLLDDTWRGYLCDVGGEWPGVYLKSSNATLGWEELFLSLQMCPLLWPFDIVKVDGPFVQQQQARSSNFRETVVRRLATRWRMLWIPSVKFYVHFHMQNAFTVYTLFVTVFIDDGYGPLHPAHHVWFAWLVTFVLQEALEMHEDGSEAWVQKGFNGRLDLALLLMLATVYFLRLSLADCDWVECLEEPRQQGMRTILAFCWLMMSARPLEVLSIHPRIGKLIVIIRKMITEFFIFLAPMALLTTGFMISFVILVPNYRLYEDAPYTSFFEFDGWRKKQSASDSGPYFGGPAAIPIWGLFGYFEPENISFSKHAVVFMPAFFLVMYELFAVVLMLNLLIALFNDVYESMREKWEGTAAIILPTIIRDYSRTYPFPAPFNVFGRVWDLIVYLYVHWPEWQGTMKAEQEAEEGRTSQRDLAKEKHCSALSLQVPAYVQRKRAQLAYQLQDAAKDGLAKMEREAHREYVERLRDERARKKLV